MSDTADVFRKAQRLLSRRDPILKRLIVQIGPCTLRHDADRFAALVRAIISQQISTKAAASIRERVYALLAPVGGVTPRGVRAVPKEVLRTAGLSEAKARSVRDLAEKVQERVVPLDDVHDWPDEQVIAHLLPVRGIGRWTAEMFLIFSLGRLDVLPVNDLGLRVGVQKQYSLPEPPARDKLEALAEPWRPYRSVATWYFWRSFGVVPQS